MLLFFPGARWRCQLESGWATTSARATRSHGRGCSVHLQVDVDVTDELEGSEEGDGAQHEEKDKARQQGVAKKLHRLDHAGHIGATGVVEDGVEEDEEAGGARAQDGAPPPAVVLARELEVGEGNGDAGPDAQQDGEDEEEDAVKGVELPAPDGGEDVVELHRNRAA